MIMSGMSVISLFYVRHVLFSAAIGQHVTFRKARDFTRYPLSLNSKTASIEHERSDLNLFIDYRVTF